MNARPLFNAPLPTVPLQYPSGRWGVVGIVPWSLYYTMADGSPLTQKVQDAIRRCGPGLLGKSIKRVTFDTEAECQAAIDKELSK